MAETSDMAPTSASRRSSRTANGRRSSARSSRTAADEADIEAQIGRLQDDLKAIAASIAGLAEDKVTDARGTAKREARHLMRAGQQAVDDVTDEFGQMERQIKDSIRAKPLTAVAGAVAVGFLLAMISR